MLMISVSALTSYLYCPRKFYMQYALGISEPARKPTLEGTILHNTIDRMQVGINQLTAGVTPQTTLKELEMSYKKIFYTGLFNAINANEADIKKLGIDKLALFKQLWEQLSEDAESKAAFVHALAKANNAYGKELAEKISASTEVRLESQTLGIRGIVDRIEERGDKTFVYEMKTGSAPREGIWPNHKIQLAAYMLMLKEQGKDVEGVLEYGKDCRKLMLNPFIEEEVTSLIDTVKSALKTPTAPAKADNENKCTNCGLKKYCDQMP